MKTVTGDNVVKMENKNKFNINWFQPRTINGITATIEDDHLLLNGTATGSAFINFAIPNSMGEMSNLYWFIKSDAQLGILQVQRTGQNVINITPTTGWSRQPISNNEDYVYTGFLRINDGTTLNNCKVYMYVDEEKVDVNNFVYVPHQEQSYPLNLGVENLCDIILNSNISSTILYKTYTLEPNTQYIISTNTYILDLFVANVFADSGESLTPSTDNNGVKGTRVVTSDSNGKITIGYRNYNNLLDYTSGNYYIQIEKGTKAHSYSPHGQEPIEFCEIGSYQDFPYKAINGDEYYDSLTDTQKENLTYGGWYKHKEMDKTIPYDITFRTNYSNLDYVQIYKPNASVNRGNYNNIPIYFECGKFKENGIGDANSINNIGYISSNADTNWYWLGLTKNKYTQETIKNILKDKVFYYALATPIEEEITNETVIEQLEAIYNGSQSYKGQTHIYTETDGLSPIFDVEYIMDEAKDIYSTEEVKTNKVWIDGKPIYRKVMTGTFSTSTSTQSVAHNILSLGDVITLRGIYTNANNNQVGSIPMYYSNDLITTLRIDSSYIHLSHTTSLHSSPYKIILEYTKTTD